MLKRLTIALASLALLTGCKPAAPTPPPPASQAKTDTLTFFVSGLECAACTESVRQSIYGLDGIQKVLMKEGLEGYATVSFATETVSAQQIAQAVHDAPPLHGTPYEASLRLKVPAYTQTDQAAKINTLLATQKTAITAEPDWDAKDQLIIRFLPLENQAPVPPRTARGWNPSQLTEALRKTSLTSTWITAE
jgi:copper chaperone CopZ